MVEPQAGCHPPQRAPGERTNRVPGMLARQVRFAAGDIT